MLGTPVRLRPNKRRQRVSEKVLQNNLLGQYLFCSCSQQVIVPVFEFVSLRPSKEFTPQPQKKVLSYLTIGLVLVVERKMLSKTIPRGGLFHRKFLT